MGEPATLARDPSDNRFGRMRMLTHSPVEWGWDRLRLIGAGIGKARPEEYWPAASLRTEAPTVRRIGIADLREALAKGLDDFAANRADVIVLCAVYPVVGLILARLAFGYEVLPLLFPLASGFALVGPFAAIGLYEMSRRRELGIDAGWSDAFEMMRSPSVGAIAALGLLLIAIFAIWMALAQTIYDATLGPLPPESFGRFIQDVFATHAGRVMMAVGVGLGFLFAVLVLAIGTLSFPLLLDRPVDLPTAVRTSVRGFFANLDMMALWGLIVVAGLVIGSIPFFFGLVIVLPVLGHATWHLYRKVVPG
jgi:uncharacterized membrane protein